MKKNSEKENSDAAWHEKAKHARRLAEIVEKGVEEINAGRDMAERIAKATEEELPGVLKEMHEKDTKAQKK